VHPLFERALAQPVEADVLVGLCDWRLFLRHCEGRTSRQLFEDLSAWYGLTEEVVESGGGLVIKFMGDAALVIFPDDLADDGIVALLELKQRTDNWFEDNGISSSLHVSVHAGQVTMGRMGKAGALDVIGQTVNRAASLRRDEFALTKEAFDCLTAKHRRLFRPAETPGLYRPATMNV
jgi:adenylate cyclase